MKAVIVGAADDFVPFRKRPGDIVIAADGGYAQPGVADAADIVIGDFDSLGYEPRGAETVRLPVERTLPIPRLRRKRLWKRAAARWSFTAYSEENSIMLSPICSWECPWQKEG